MRALAETLTLSLANQLVRAIPVLKLSHLIATLNQIGYPSEAYISYKTVKYLILQAYRSSDIGSLIFGSYRLCSTTPTPCRYPLQGETICDMLRS